jgi:hypothetical protein
MTVEREIISTEIAVLSAVRRLSDAEVEAATGRTVSWFRKCSDPNHPSRLSFDDAAKLDAALLRRGLRAEFSPLLAVFIERTLAQLGGMPAATGEEPHACLLRIMTSLGETAKTLETAMEDGVLDRHERREIARLCDLIADHAHALKQSVEPPAEVTPIRGAR